MTAGSLLADVVASASRLSTGHGILAATVDGQTVMLGNWQGTAPQPDATHPPPARFQLASAAKSITALVAACLVDDGLLGWDSPLSDVIPGLRLAGAGGTADATLRDALCHRTGLPRHDGVVFGAPGLTRADLVPMMQHLDISSPPRDRFQYNNLMYAIVGHVCEQVTGVAWPELVQSKVLRALGMSSTSVTDDVLAPAGSVVTTAEDMCLWMRANSMPDNVLAHRSKAMHKTEIRLDPSGLLPTATTGYGRGWFTGDYRGHPIVHHGGAVPGAGSLVALIPKQRVGVTILVDGGSSDGVCEAIAYQVLDGLLGLSPVDWAEQVGARSMPNSAPSPHDLTALESSHEGTYVHPAYGVVTVSGSMLNWRGMDLQLFKDAQDGLVLRAADDQVWPVSIDDLSVRLPLEPAVEPIRFDRVPDSREVPA